MPTLFEQFLSSGPSGNGTSKGDPEPVEILKNLFDTNTQDLSRLAGVDLPGSVNKFNALKAAGRAAIDQSFREQMATAAFDVQSFYGPFMNRLSHQAQGDKYHLSDQEIADNNKEIRSRMQDILRAEKDLNFVDDDVQGILKEFIMRKNRPAHRADSLGYEIREAEAKVSPNARYTPGEIRSLRDAFLFDRYMTGYPQSLREGTSFDPTTIRREDVPRDSAQKVLNRVRQSVRERRGSLGPK